MQGAWVTLLVQVIPRAVCRSLLVILVGAEGAMHILYAQRAGEGQMVGHSEAGVPALLVVE